MNTYRKIVTAACPLSLLVFLPGCATSSALQTSTVSTGRTATDIVYEMVLDNLATIKSHPDALPWHIKVTQGSISVTDTVTPPGFTFTWPTISRSSTATIGRSWAVSWTVVPVVDKQTLISLRDRYRAEAADSFTTFYEMGSSAPSDSISAKTGDAYIWVKNNQVAHFTTLVTDVLANAPVSASERGIQLPGPLLSAPPVVR